MEQQAGALYRNVSRPGHRLSSVGGDCLHKTRAGMRPATRLLLAESCSVVAGHDVLRM